MDRRTLLKIMGGIAALPALGKAIKGTGIKAIKAAGKVLPKVSGMPEWFSPLVNKIMKEGKDISPKVSRVEDMETIKRLEIPSETGKPEVITLTQNKATGKISIETNIGGVADSPFELSYTPPKTDINLQTGEPVKYPGDFSVIENRPKPDYNNIGKVEFDYDNFDIDSAYSDLERLEKIGTGKIKDVKKMEQRAKGRKMVEDSPYEDIMDRSPGPPEPDDFANGGIASFANGGKAKKKLLENESKNQELSPEELEEKYQQEINDLLTRPASPGLKFNTEEGGQGGINLMFGPKTKQNNYPGFGPRPEENINPRIDIRDPRIGISYTSDPEDRTASRFGLNVGPKGAYVGYSRNFANGGVANMFRERPEYSLGGPTKAIRKISPETPMEEPLPSGLAIKLNRPVQSGDPLGSYYDDGKGPLTPGFLNDSYGPVNSITGLRPVERKMGLFTNPDGSYPSENISPNSPRIGPIELTGVLPSQLQQPQTSQIDISTNPIARALEMAGFTKEEIMRIISERGYADGGLTKTVPPAKGPNSQGVESLFRRRYS